MTKIKMVVFDLYGTLIHVKRKTGPYRLLLETISPNHRKEFMDIVLCTNFTKTPEDEIALFNLGNTIDVAKFTTDLNTELESAEFYPETTEVLTELCRRGFMIGVISNLATPYKKPFYHLSINRLIDYAIFSCDTGFVKPSPSIYEKMSQKSGFALNEMLMIGDSQSCDVKGPMLAGMNAILLDRNDSCNKTKKINTLDEILKIL